MARPSGALAKLSRPRLHDVVPRPRLYALLDKAARRPLSWLCAQPGAGKTTLLASWLEARKRGGLWYQVDDGDADPASFIYHLRLAAPDAAPLPLLTPEYLHDLRGYARRFFRALFAQFGDGDALVLDNLQEVPEGSAFHRLVAVAAEQLPAGVRIVVASHAEPGADYAALLAADAIALVDAEALRLTPAESHSIVRRKRGKADEAQARALHERSLGWAAGLTLLLARTPRTASSADDPEALQHVFGYFAQRVFDHTPERQRELLLQLAFLPVMTAQMAEQLTGSADGARLLEQHYKRHWFTDRRRVGAPGSSPVYHFHDLFRSFLLHHAAQALGGAACRQLAQRAGGVLEHHDLAEQALALYAEALEWPAYAGLVDRHAERLLQQGRQQTLLEWLARLPDAARADRPWLVYWEGRALMPSAPERALRLLQEGFQYFAGAGDAAGQLACAAALVQTLWFARLGWSEITPWVDRLEPLLGRTERYPSPAMELMTSSALHAALTFCRLSHPSIRPLGLRLLALVEDPQIDWNERLATAAHLITWLHNAAEHELATRLIGKVDAQLANTASRAQAHAYWLVFRAMHDLRAGRHEAAVQHFDEAEQLARREGLAHAEFAALQFRTFLDLLLRRHAAAAATLTRLEAHPARGNADAELNVSVLHTLLAQAVGDTHAALEHAQRARAAIERVGAAYFRAVYAVMLASAYADAGQPDTALQIVAEARALARGTYLAVMEAQLLLEEAYVEICRGRDPSPKLAQACALAAADRAQAAYVHRIVARKPVLLVRALQAGIEPDFVRRLIRRWRIPPPADDLPQWPWAVRVTTLGRFEVLVDDAPIEFGRKAPKKTLALLKAVIARGGSAPESALVDIFWPDEDGDTAARSLGAAVHRLRTLLGDADAVIQHGSRVALDRERVWVDAWAFEHAPRAGLALYRGSFLAEEEGAAWPVALRERLRSKFVQAVADEGASLEAAGRNEAAVACYLRGLDADPVVEPFYQGLMRCYHRLDRLPEAVSAYRRLKQTLSIMLSLPPSAGTERLYRSLRLAAHEIPNK